MTLQSADYVFNRTNNLVNSGNIRHSSYKKNGFFLGLGGFVAMAVYFLVKVTSQETEVIPAVKPVTHYLSVAMPDMPERIIPPRFSPFTKTDKPLNVTLKLSDSFEDTLLRYGIAPYQLDKIIDAIKPHADIHSLRRNHPITLRIEKNNALDVRDIEDMPHVVRSINFNAEAGVDIEVTGDGERYFAKTIYKEVVEKPVLVSGRVNSSLARDAVKAGVPYKMITQFIKMFSLTIDFRDLQKDDTFEFGFDSFYDDAENRIGTGRLTYASLTVNGKKNEIYYIRNASKEEGGEWFNENGMNTKPLLMKTPIDGARLSSTFGMRRHPILGYTRQHAGIDFAAPTGTPIYAAGNGVVVKKYRSSSYGNYVKIRHSNSYDTAYAHMVRFARINEGEAVKQGQVIGYVGTTGRSTGPHLHYEVHKGGIPINPLSDKVPTVSTVTAEMKRNMNEIKERVGKLRKGKDISITHKSIHAIKHKFI